MRPVPETLAAHLSGDATTTCHAWRVTRRDGRIVGFTDHDRDLVFAATTFLAASGFSASETATELGFAPGSDEVAGGFSSTALDEADLAAGLYDGARVDLFLVNWADPEAHMLLQTREIGEVTRAGGAFRSELRSLAHRLAQPQGRVYDRRCDAALGDGRCRVDLAAWQTRGIVRDVPDRNGMTVTGLETFADGFFDRGTIRFDDGLAADVERQQAAGDGRTLIRFWLPLERDLAPGQGFTITAGCDKTFATCRARFANHLNFRGFPHVPGSDFAYSYVDGEQVHDGGPLFS